jgi:hypothetical protein
MVVGVAAWADMPQDPTACPAVDAIKSAGLSGVMEEKTYQVYAVYQIGKYNTPTTWGFMVAVPFSEATSRADAVNKARSALQTLSGTPTPTPRDDAHKQWYCLYDNNYHYVSAAVTPLMSQAAIQGVVEHQAHSAALAK